MFSLATLKYFAEVFVNGERAGSVCAAPFRLRLDRRYLKTGENELTVKIANLAAVAYAKTDAYAFFNKKHIGPYHDTALGFERAVSGGGFDGLRVDRLK